MNDRTVNVQADVSEFVKENAEALFEELGLDLATAIRMFLIASLNRNGLPFEVVAGAQDVPNAETQRILQEVLDGKNMSKTYDSVEEAMRDMLEDVGA
jgi:DNA-damage-inducible protein J